MKISQSQAGYFYNQPVRRFKLENDVGMSVQLLELGGIITSLVVPDAKGDQADVVLGSDQLRPYVSDRHYFGALIGRVANRIEGARYLLNGEVVAVDANAHEGRHCVHGGRFGYHRRVWRLVQTERDADRVAIKLALKDLDGEEGFRNAIDVSACYELDNQNRLTLEFTASADGPTPISLTAHPYFNLAGHKTGSIAGHHLTLFCDHYLAQKEDRIPTGEILPVAGTDLDFQQETHLATCVEREEAINHSYVFDKGFDVSATDMRLMARLRAEGRQLEVWSNEATLHFYNGHNLDGVSGKDGALYSRFAGLCLEPKGFVNGVNEPAFPCTIIDQGKSYQHRIEYRFTS